MTVPSSAGARLRAALAHERPLQVVGTVNAFSALLAERAGFRSIYLSGAGVANASFGLPDLGITSLNDVCEDVRRIAGLLRSMPADKRPGFEGNLATAFGCTLEGTVPESKVVELAVALMEAGCDDIGLSDTTGYANPAQVRRLIRLVRQEVGRDKLSSVHLHNTRGLGLANALADRDRR